MIQCNPLWGQTGKVRPQEQHQGPRAPKWQGRDSNTDFSAPGWSLSTCQDCLRAGLRVQRAQDKCGWTTRVGGGWGFGAPPQPPEEGGGRFRSSAATYLGRRPERGEDEGLRAGPAEGGRPSVSHQGPEPINPPLLMRESPVFSPLSPLKNVGATDQAQREEERAPCRPSPSALPLGLPTAHRLLRPVPTSSAPVSLPAATETQSPQTTPVNLPPPRRSKALKLNSLSNAVTLEGAFMDSTGIMI